MQIVLYIEIKTFVFLTTCATSEIKTFFFPNNLCYFYICLGAL